MNTIADLMKEKTVVRATNLIRSDLLGLLLSESKLVAKERGEGVKIEDFIACATSWKKKLTKTLPDLPLASPQRAKILLELTELDTFLPSTLSAFETKVKITEIVASLPEADHKNRKAILTILKTVANVDMAVANQIITEFLK